MTDDREGGEERRTSSLSRRDFLKQGAVGIAGAVGAGLAPGALLAGEPGSEAPPRAGDRTPLHGPGAVPMTLRINGSSKPLTAEPRTTLLDALRDHLDLTGAKKVCDRGSCGACTVLLDGKPAYACSILAIDAQDREITTVESLGSPDALHPLQAAFVENDAQQCGACTPGFVMACKSLLDRHPNPSDAEIDEGLGGNLCRCGTYPGIRKAVRQAAASAAATTPKGRG